MVPLFTLLGGNCAPLLEVCSESEHIKIWLASSKSRGEAMPHCFVSPFLDVGWSGEDGSGLRGDSRETD